jgi:hypothetical protein
MPRYRLPAVLAALAMCIMLTAMLSGVAMNVWIMGFPDTTPDNLGRFFMVLGVFRSFLSAVAIGVLLFAVFTGRSSPQIAHAQSVPPVKSPPV